MRKRKVIKYETTICTCSGTCLDVDYVSIIDLETGMSKRKVISYGDF